MKNMFKFWGIIAFSAVIVFSMIGCGEDNSGDKNNQTGNNNKPGDGSINFSDAKWSNIDVYNSDGSAIYNGSDVAITKVGNSTGGEPFSEVSSNPTAWNIKIVDNKLSIALGTPDLAAHSADLIPDSVNPDGLKVVCYQNFKDDNGGSISLYDPNAAYYVYFTHADKAGIISGSVEGMNYNLNLKAGWNTVIYTQDHVTTEVPSNNCKWAYYGD